MFSYGRAPNVLSIVWQNILSAKDIIFVTYLLQNDKVQLTLIYFVQVNIGKHYNIMFTHYTFSTSGTFSYVWVN